MRTRMFPVAFVISVSLCALPKNVRGASAAESAIRGWLDTFAVMEADNESDPNYFKDQMSPGDLYRRLEKLCEESGTDKRRILDVAKEVADGYETAVNAGQVACYPNVAKMILVMAASGDRTLLPYFEEKSLASATYKSIRSGAASAYINLADLSECIGFMKKILEVNGDNGAWRFMITPLILGKIEAAINAGELSGAEKERVLSVLLSYMRAPASSWEASKVDAFLAKHCDGYLTSVQRMSMARDISDAGNERERKHFLPIRESVEALPKKQRVDLRERFPDLPPLPEEKEGRPSVPVWIGGGVAVVIGVAALLRFLLWKRRAAP